MTYLKFRTPLLLLSAGLVFAATLFSAAAHDVEILKAGKEGRISLDSTVLAGDSTLRPGNYTVQHRAEGGRHFVRFTRIGWRKSPAQKLVRRTAVIEAEVPCHVEALPQIPDATAFYLKTQDGTAHLTRIEVRGETIAHLF